MFTGKLVKLRSYKREDVPAALGYMNDVEVYRNLMPSVPYPFTLEDQERWYSNQSAVKDTYNFAIETLDEGKYIGGCGVNSVDWKNSNVVIGIFIGDQGYWSHGYGSDALQLLIRFIFNEMNIHKIKLEVYSFNKRAIRCYEKCGFKQEGILREEIFKNGQYYDKWVMGLLRSEWKN